MATKPDLDKIVESISIDSSEEFDEIEFINMLKKKMPGYEIQTWNLDDYTSSMLAGSVSEKLTYPISQGKSIEDIQYVEEWCTDDCGVYEFILAYKTKEN